MRLNSEDCRPKFSKIRLRLDLPRIGFIAPPDRKVSGYLCYCYCDGSDATKEKILGLIHLTSLVHRST
jgi:hypothetical protein